MVAETVMEAYYGLINLIREEKNLSYQEMKKYIQENDIQKPVEGEAESKGFFSFLSSEDYLDNLFEEKLRNANEFDLTNLKRLYHLAEEEGVRIFMVFPVTEQEKIEAKYTTRTRKGDYVKDSGEEAIADILLDWGFDYEYGKIIAVRTNEPIHGYTEHNIKAGFYLIEYDIYIEYWGYPMTYVDHMCNKKHVWMNQSDLKVIMLDSGDYPAYDRILKIKLSCFGVRP